MVLVALKAFVRIVSRLQRLGSLTSTLRIKKMNLEITIDEAKCLCVLLTHLKTWGANGGEYWGYFDDLEEKLREQGISYDKLPLNR